jgi:PAS domain S-box-containing protein
MLLEPSRNLGRVNLQALTMAIEATHDAVVITEAERSEGGRGHRIVYVNAAFERMTGYTREEAVGHTCSMLHGPNTDREAREKIGSALDSWRSVRAEIINYRKDGSEFVVELQIDPLADETGWYTHWISVQRDVTERIAKEKQLARAAEQVRIGVEVARLGLGVVNYATNMIELSRSAARMFGLGESEITVTRKRLHETFHPDDAAELRLRIAEALDPAGLGWFETDHRVVWPNGEARWLRARKQVQFEGEGSERRPIQGMLAAFDVTVSKRAEAALQESQRRFRDLAGGVAHDFNNLLTAIGGHAAMLAALNLDAETKLHTTAIQEAATSASEVTRQLLDLSGRHVMSADVLNVNHCIASAVEVLKPTWGAETQVQVLLDPASGQVWMNRTRLNQIVLNLLVNARDAIEGPGIVTIATSHVRRSQAAGGDPRGGFVQIVVTDSGSGIKPAALEHVFEPYFSTKTGPDGLSRGLGLAIVHAIVTDCEGSIEVENVPGAGARFTVLLPSVGEQPHRGSAPELPCVEESARAKTILFAEDDKRVRDLVEGLLRNKGFHVLAAEDGQAAFELAQTHPGPISLLLSDVRMPRMDGPSLARAITQARPRTPTLLLSGFLASALQGKQDFDPKWHFLEKPFSMDALVGKLAELNLISS